MKVVDLEQRTSEWHQWRRDGVSATSCSVIMGENPDKTPLQLWRELVGLDTPPNLSCIPQVKKGVKLEPLALQAFEDQYGQLGLPICAESSEHPFIRASFDGLLADGSPVEIKNLSEDNHLQVLNKREHSKAFQLYRWQIMHQLIVCGAQRGYLWCWSPKHTPICLVVDRDELLVKRIIAKEKAFWDLVISGDSPEPDPKRDVIPQSKLDMNAWRLAAAQRREKELEMAELKKRLAAVQREAKELDAEFLVMMGEFKRADALGIRVTAYDVEGRVDWKAVVEALEENIPPSLIEAHRSDSHSATRITVDTSFDEAAVKPDPMPRIRKKAEPVPELQPMALGVFVF